MPSTFSPSLRLELIGNGEQAANWGNTTNTNLGTLIEQAITGVVNVTVSGSPTTLVSGNGISDEARNAVLILGGSPGGNADLIVPTAEKLYVVRNATTGGHSITVKMATGTGVTVANGFTQAMYCDGTNVVLYTLPVRASDGSMGNIIATGATISGSSSTDLVRITQTGTGNALVIEDGTNPDATPFVVDPEGKLIAGYTGAIAFNGGAYLGNFLGAQATLTYPIVAGFTDASSTGPKVTLVKNRSADWSTQTPVVSGDVVGDIDFLASDGTNFLPGARIQAVVDGTPGTNDLPTRMTFSTTADGAATPTERMRITPSGNVGIGTTAPGEKLSVEGGGISVNNSGAGALGYIEIGGADGAYVDLKTPFADDYDFRIYTNSTQHELVGKNAIPMIFSTNFSERMRITSDGKIGVGTGSLDPVAQVGVYGLGQNTYLTFNTSTNLGGTIYARDAGSLQYNGGAIMFGANQGAWAAIKGWLEDGANNTNGALSVYTRGATTDANLTERARFAKDGTFAFNSGFGGVATAYGCRAWVNFNGTTNVGGFCTINGSGNITSVTDNGVGTYTLNFTNNMPDANYSLSACALAADNGNTVGTVACIERNSSTGLPQLKTTSAVQVSTFWVDRNNKNDVSDVSFQIFR